MTDEDIKGLLEKPLDLGDLKCHTQAVERAVKNITFASKSFSSEEKRDGVE